MASTNKTTNYELSQFASTDKPAWLGDYNQDMVKIDTGMKDNATGITNLGTTVAGHTSAIAGNTSDIATLQTSVGTNTSNIATLQSSVATNTSNIATNAGDIDVLETRVGTVETGLSNQDLRIQSLETDNATNKTNISANTTAINNTATELNNFELKLNLTNISNITTISGYSGLLNDGVNLTLAQNSDGSIFKLYGYASGYLSSTTTASLTQVKGLSGTYGIKTTLHLATAPTEAYVISCAGLDRVLYENIGRNTKEINIAVDTDGYIYICVSTQSTLQYQAYWSHRNILFPCVYFNGSFGDVPTPPEPKA